MVDERCDDQSAERLCRGYKLKYLMIKHVLRRDIAQGLIDLVGNDRARLNEAVAMLGRS